MKLTSIITVNFNQPEVTIDFLRSVKLHTAQSEVEVIVVDNGSKEDYQQDFLNEYPEIIYISSEKNLGFAGGNNLGIQSAKGDIFILNNDTEITANLVSELIRELDSNKEIGLISPLLLYFDDPDIIQYAGTTQ